MLRSHEPVQQARTACAPLTAPVLGVAHRRSPWEYFSDTHCHSFVSFSRRSLSRSRDGHPFQTG